GSTLIMSVDAPWDGSQAGSITRAFAGRESASFATGTARLARLAQCPIVLCMPRVEPDGRVVLHWKKVIATPDRRDAEADITITSLLLDEIEHAIGCRPEQYVMDILGERRWNAEQERWESPPAPC